MNYQYDVFLSYCRGFPWIEWVDGLFFPFFEAYLKEALGREISIFKDTNNIEGGSAWQKEIKNGLAKSRCMVAIWTPTYFLSEWCVKEFAVFDYRQNKLGYLSDDNTKGLILPIKLFDGKHYQKHLSRMQALDCTKFNRIGKCIEGIPLYSDLQMVLQHWVLDVEKVVCNAPCWQQEWLSKDWLDEPFNNAKVTATAKMGEAPNL